MLIPDYLDPGSYFVYLLVFALLLIIPDFDMSTASSACKLFDSCY